MANEPQKLDYATRVGAYRSARKHPSLIVWLIGLTALAGVWAGIVGVLYSTGWPACAGPLAGGGVALCWAALGYLPAANIRLRPALLLLTIAVALEGRALYLVEPAYESQLARYGDQLTGSYSYRAPVTNAEGQVLPYQMLRNVAGASTALGLATWLYVGVWLVARQGHEL